MTQPITMPALSDTMSNGRLVKWTRRPGDPVKKGDIVAEVETDKAVMEVEASSADLGRSQSPHFDDAVPRLGSHGDLSKQGTMQFEYLNLADDYCNARCGQQFNYCQFRGESPDRCARRLIRCRENC
jgi:Biotin-requiring enzyme